MLLHDLSVGQGEYIDNPNVPCGFMLLIKRVQYYC